MSLKEIDRFRQLRSWQLLVLSSLLSLASCAHRSGGLVAASPGGGNGEFGTTVLPNAYPSYWGFLVAANEGSEDIVLRSVRLLQLSKGLRSVGFAVMRQHENESFLFIGCGPFPPSNWTTHPVKGLRVRPGETISIVPAVRPETEGLKVIRNLEVTYSSGTKTKKLKLEFLGKLTVRSSAPKCLIDKIDHREPTAVPSGATANAGAQRGGTLGSIAQPGSAYPFDVGESASRIA